MEEVHKKNKLTQRGSHILTSILMSHMVTKNPQNVHRKYFWAILLTFIFDVKIDCEPHYVNLFFFVNLLHSLHVWLFDIWHLFDILTHQLNLNHLSPHRAIFSTISNEHSRDVILMTVKCFDALLKALSSIWLHTITNLLYQSETKWDNHVSNIQAKSCTYGHRG